MSIPLLKDADISGKTVLVRVDYNVPLENGTVADDSRIRESLPTVKHLLAHNCKVILMSHLGRPNGKVVEAMRMNVVAAQLSLLIHEDVRTVNDCIGKDVEGAVARMPAHSVLLLENLRFHPEEEANDASFAKQLAGLANVYVNDAFGASHRAHASVSAITAFLPSYAGFLLEKEITTLTSLLGQPAKPFVAILGGAKVSDKIGVIRNLLPKVDGLLVGGAMMFTFLKAQGMEVGTSLVEDDQIAIAKELLGSGKIVLPCDVVISAGRENTSGVSIVPVTGMPIDQMGLDIGPKSIEDFQKRIVKARTVVWNGPLGLFEADIFAKGTFAIAKAVAENGGVSVIGGGDTLSAAEKAGVACRFTHVSTGGGAMLELLEGKTLPAIQALAKKG